MVLFAAARAIAHASPPRVLVVYRELQPHIQYLKAALAGYLSLSERIRRLEDLENYEATVSLKLLAVCNTLHSAAPHLSMRQCFCPFLG